MRVLVVCPQSGDSCNEPRRPVTTTECRDSCPDDPRKSSPGICGCGVLDLDGDQDGALDCEDQCPEDSLKQLPGICGCGVSDEDSDRDPGSDSEVVR